MKRRVGVVVALVLAAAIACSSADRIVGDDSPTSPAEAGSSSVDKGDAGSVGSSDATTPPDLDAAVDAPVEAATDGGCIVISLPVTGACDGGVTAVPTYNSITRCINAYACPPITCVAAGGACVALSPFSCKAGTLGASTDYSCGGGLGVECCLP